MSSPFLNEVRPYTMRTERTYVYWIRFYIRFLAMERNVSGDPEPGLKRARFLYKQVLQLDEFALPAYTQATPRKKIPVVLTREEARRIIDKLQDHHPKRMRCDQLSRLEKLELRTAISNTANIRSL